MTKHVLFIQGAGSKGSHAYDAKLVDSLKQKLGRGYGVRYPKMPNEAEPDYAAWKRRISRELTTLGNDVVLVGHSIGASVVIKFLADGAPEHSVAGAFLIAAPFWHDHKVWKWTEAELPADAANKIPSEAPLFLYHGRADETVPLSHLDMYAKRFPQAIFRVLDGRDHQLNDDLTEVADDIKRLQR